MRRSMNQLHCINGTRRWRLLGATFSRGRISSRWCLRHRLALYDHETVLGILQRGGAVS